MGRVGAPWKSQYRRSPKALRAHAACAAHSKTTRPITRFSNIRVAKLGYRNYEISKVEYARIRDIFTTRDRRQITELKQMCRNGKITKREYKRLAQEAEIALKG